MQDDVERQSEEGLFQEKDQQLQNRGLAELLGRPQDAGTAGV